MEKNLNKSGEALRNGRNNLIYLPLVDLGYPNIPVNLIQGFKPELYAQNHRLLKLAEQFYKNFGAKGEKGFRRGSYPIPSVKPDQAAQIVASLQKSHNSNVTLSNLIQEPGPLEMDPSELRDSVNHQLNRANGQTSILSTSHVTDFHMIESLRQRGVDLSKVGIIVVDQHIDGSSSLHPSGQFILDKSNFLIPVLDGGIGAVSIVGLDEEDIPRIKKEDRETAETINQDGTPSLFQEVKDGLRNLQDFYTKYQDRLNIAPGIFGEGRKMSKPKKVIEYVRKQVEFMKSRGIEQILISFDMDSLDLMKEKITATPYTPYSSIILMGLQDLNKIFTTAGVSEAEVEDEIRTMMHLRLEIDNLKKLRKRKGALSPRENSLLERKEEDFGSVVSRVYPIIYNMEEGLHELKAPVAMNGPLDVLAQMFQGAHIINSDEGGFTLDQAEFLIQSIKTEIRAQGLENGVALQSGRLMGSVSELDGPDMEGISASSAIRMVNILNS